MFAWLVIVVIIVVFANEFSEQGKNKQKPQYTRATNTEKFVIGDLVRIKGESHEWAIVQILDDNRVLLDYNDDGNDYEALLVAGMEEVELA
jgi:putative ribosome biogenesis GTPase RsgA